MLILLMLFMWIPVVVRFVLIVVSFWSQELQRWCVEWRWPKGVRRRRCCFVVELVVVGVGLLLCVVMEIMRPMAKLVGVWWGCIRNGNDYHIFFIIKTKSPAK